jgi:hydrogenase small subunit
MSVKNSISRREFLKWAAAAPVSATFLPKLAQALQEAIQKYPIIWLQTSTCSGCSVSVINTIHPSIKNVILEQVLPGHQLILTYHGTLMAATGTLSIKAARESAQKYQGKYVLVVEGAIPTKADGHYGSIGEDNGKPISMLKWVDFLGGNAMVTLAVGTCAAYGGIPAASPNPSQCKGVSEVYEMLKISTPVINIPGCPSHPDWFIGTVAKILLYGMPTPDELDEIGRLKLFFSRTVHNRCVNRDFLDDGIMAEKFGDEGCLLELGCKGPFTRADCPIRLWNGSVNWCINAGAPCIGCTEKGFPDEHSPLFQRR